MDDIEEMIDKSVEGAADDCPTIDSDDPIQKWLERCQKVRNRVIDGEIARIIMASSVSECPFWVTVGKAPIGLPRDVEVRKRKHPMMARGNRWWRVEAHRIDRAAFAELRATTIEVL